MGFLISLGYGVAVVAALAAYVIGFNFVANKLGCIEDDLLSALLMPFLMPFVAVVAFLAIAMIGNLFFG